MPESLRIAWEHNRALPVPMRIGHVLWAIWSPVHNWASSWERRWWALPALYGLLSVLVLWEIDPIVLNWVTANHTRGSLPLGGDLRRELEMLGQFGQGAMTALVALVIWQLDSAHRRRMLQWLWAIVWAFVLAFGLKMLIGRPRPVLDEPNLILGPFGAYPLGPGQGVAHSLAFWSHGISKLWSMPSSHTVFAVTTAVVLSRWYPKLKGLMIVMAALVAFSRIAFGAHYPSDVAAGVALGLIAANAGLRWGDARD